MPVIQTTGPPRNTGSVGQGINTVLVAGQAVFISQSINSIIFGGPGVTPEERVGFITARLRQGGNPTASALSTVEQAVLAAGLAGDYQFFGRATSTADYAEWVDLLNAALAGNPLDPNRIALLPVWAKDP